MAHDSVPVPHRTAGRSTGSTGDPSTGRNGVPGAEPTRRPTARPTATLTSEPATDPDPAPTRPPESTTPVLDERLLTITSYGDGNGGPATRSAVPAAVTAPAEQRLLTLTVPANSTEPLTVELGYGARLGWPVGPNPAGWSCLRKAGGAGGTCTATTPGKPKVLRLKFAMPTGGSAAHRTFTVAARSGRLHDQDSETLVARRRPDHSPPRISRPRPADGPRRFPYNRVPLRGAAAGRYVATSPTPPRPASRFGGPGSLA